MSRLPRFGPLLTRWTLAVMLVCVSLGWPLHEALHARAGVGDAAQAVSATTPDVLTMQADDVDSDGSADEHDESDPRAAKSCRWCLFHGAHLVAPSAPTALIFHAEAARPPAAPPGSPLPRRSLLAAEPRGPPLA